MYLYVRKKFIFTYFLNCYKPFIINNKKIVPHVLSSHSNHSISFYFFHFFQSSKSFHSILIFSTNFFNFSNPYIISLNLNYLYHFEICKIKLFFKLFKMIKNNQNNFSKHKGTLL